MGRTKRYSSRLILVLGGAASGKSQVALEMARGLAPRRGVCPHEGDRPRAKTRKKGVSPRVAFVATGQALDGEMAERIKRHQVARCADWTTAEVPVDLADWFRKQGREYRTIVLDCLTLWLSNLRGQRVRDSAVPDRVTDLLDAVRSTQARVVMVSNELGLGLVPASRDSRSFRDLAGRVNQQVAAEADEVYFVISGLPVQIK